MKKTETECDIYELTAWCLCIIHFFLIYNFSSCHMKSLHALKKICILT